MTKTARLLSMLTVLFVLLSAASAHASTDWFGVDRFEALLNDWGYTVEPVASVPTAPAPGVLVVTDPYPTPEQLTGLWEYVEGGGRVLLPLEVPVDIDDALVQSITVGGGVKVEDPHGWNDDPRFPRFGALMPDDMAWVEPVFNLPTFATSSLLSGQGFMVHPLDYLREATVGGRPLGESQCAGYVVDGRFEGVHGVHLTLRYHEDDHTWRGRFSTYLNVDTRRIAIGTGEHWTELCLEIVPTRGQPAPLGLECELADPDAAYLLPGRISAGRDSALYEFEIVISDQRLVSISHEAGQFRSDVRVWRGARVISVLGRAVVLADHSVITNQMLLFDENRYMLWAMMRWLAEDTDPVVLWLGEPTPKEGPQAGDVSDDKEDDKEEEGGLVAELRAAMSLLLPLPDGGDGVMLELIVVPLALVALGLARRPTSIGALVTETRTASNLSRFLVKTRRWGDYDALRGQLSREVSEVLRFMFGDRSRLWDYFHDCVRAYRERQGRSGRVRWWLFAGRCRRVLRQLDASWSPTEHQRTERSFLSLYGAAHKLLSEIGGAEFYGRTETGSVPRRGRASGPGS